MKYTIRELEAFSVIGQEVELTNYHKRNIQISTQFWRKFNADLKKSYLSVEHIGSMDNLYETYRKIYQEILPNTDYTPLQEEFLHFERYDYRFHWNRENSIIEIWIPIKG